MAGKRRARRSCSVDHADITDENETKDNIVHKRLCQQDACKWLHTEEEGLTLQANQSGVLFVQATAKPFFLVNADALSYEKRAINIIATREWVTPSSKKQHALQCFYSLAFLSHSSLGIWTSLSSPNPAISNGLHGKVTATNLAGLSCDGLDQR